MLESDGYYYYGVTLNGKWGAYDLYGEEIVAPRYESLICRDGIFQYKDASGKMASTGISLKKGSSSSHVSGNSSNSNSSSSSSTVIPTPTPQPQPQPQPQPRPMQVWKPCPYCQGSGKCHVCLGDGHPLTNPTGTCIVCNGRGICSHCAGHGGQNVIEYH